MSVFESLLQVQDHDTAADQLRHRRQSLPELKQLMAMEDAVVRLGGELVEATARRDDVARRQRRLEGELAAVESKIDDIEGRLYSGTVTVPRELQAMQAEVETLRDRRSSLEDVVLEAMTEREPLDAEVERLEGERDRIDAEAGKLRVQVAEAQAAIDAELAAELEARRARAVTLPPDLAALYEQLRTKHGGIGAARLTDGRCGGCHLSLPATELDRFRREPPDAVLRCEQCGRILVR